MNKWWLKIFGIAFALSFQLSHTMEKNQENQTNFSDIPNELKELIVLYSVEDYINQNFDINDLENLEKNLYSLINGFPEYMQNNLIWGQVNKELKALGRRRRLDRHFKYLLTLKLNELDINIRKNLIETLQIDKQCSDLLIVLIVLSTLEPALKSTTKFNKIYELMKKAIRNRSIFICRSLPGHNFAHDFRYSNTINFDPAQFKDTELLEIFIDQYNANYDKCIFDVYDVALSTKSELKKKLLDKIKDNNYFKEKYLSTDLAKAIAAHNLEEVKNLLGSDSENIDNTCNEMKFTPVALAVIFESIEIIEYLIVKKANTRATNFYHRHALYYAATSKSHVMYNLLAKRKKQKSRNKPRNIGYILKIAIITGYFELFEFLIKNYKDKITQFNSEDVQQILSLATRKNRDQMLTILLDLYQNHDLKDILPHFLYQAIANNCVDVAALLCNKTNATCDTKLIFEIALYGDLKKMKLLITLGFDVKLKKRVKKALYTIAQENNHEEIAALLEKFAISSSSIKNKKCLIS